MTALGRAPASASLRDRRDRRGELLQAAIHVFYAKSFPGASMQDIADAIGVLKGSVYHYIDSKDELLEQIFAVGRAQVDRQLEEVRAFTGSPEERLRRFVEIQVAWYLEHHELATILSRELPYLPDASRRQALERREAYFDFVRGLVADCRPPGIDTAASADHSLRFILGAVEASREWHARSGFQRPSAAARTYAELVMRTLGLADR